MKIDIGHYRSRDTWQVYIETGEGTFWSDQEFKTAERAIIMRDVVRGLFNPQGLNSNGDETSTK